jgi:hypothetical protein
VVVVDDIAYVTWHSPDTLGSGGLTALGLADPANPTALGRFNTIMAWAMSLVITGHDAYLMTTRGMVILDLADPTAMTEVGNVEDAGMPIKALVHGDQLFLIWGQPCVVPSYPLKCDHSLRVLDVTAPAVPETLESYDLLDEGDAYIWPDAAQAMGIVDGFLYVPVNNDSWAVFRIRQD